MAKRKPAAKAKATKPTVKRKAAAEKDAPAKQAVTSSDKKFALQQQIEVLQRQMQDIDQEAIAELKSKLADAKKAVSTLEAELDTLTGKPADGPKTKRTRRPSITDEHLRPQLLAVMAKHRRGGTSAR